MSVKMSLSEQPTSGDLSGATQALLQAAEALNKTAERMLQTMQSIDRASQPQGSAAPAAAPVAQINIFEDDPFSEAAATPNPAVVATTVANTPVNNNALL